MKEVLDKVRVIVYRFHEKGLEVFMIDPELDQDPIAWKIPQSKAKHLNLTHQAILDGIDLDITVDENGTAYRTFAVEGDWHDIPSLRGIIKSDVNRIKNKIREISEKGTYVTIKDALKRVMPNEYAALKELKDILKERNLTTNM